MAEDVSVLAKKNRVASSSIYSYIGDDTIRLVPSRRHERRLYQLFAPDPTQGETPYQSTSPLASITDAGRVLHVKGYRIGLVQGTSNNRLLRDRASWNAAFRSHLHLARQNMFVGDKTLKHLVIAACEWISQNEPSYANIVQDPKGRWTYSIKPTEQRQDVEDKSPNELPDAHFFELEGKNKILEHPCITNDGRWLFAMSPFTPGRDQANVFNGPSPFMGLGLPGMKLGDAIYTIRGFSYPVAVRPIEGGRYIWLGAVSVPLCQIGKKEFLGLLDMLPEWSAQEREELRGQHLFVPNLEARDSVWEDMAFV